MIPPSSAAAWHLLARGVRGLPGGFAFLPESRALICADAHFGYEDVVGGALPLWSTASVVAAIAVAARRHAVREIVFLGDLVHGSVMSEGAVRAVRSGLASLSGPARLTFVAGNHEGRTRGRSILGETVEACERDGWLLVHGDKPPPVGTATIIGHLHPSLHLGAGAPVPAFLGSPRLVVVPALTPYSAGLDVCSGACADALAPYGVKQSELHVVAATDERVFPFGTLSRLRAALHGAGHSHARRDRRKRLRPDVPQRG